MQNQDLKCKARLSLVFAIVLLASIAAFAGPDDRQLELFGTSLETCARKPADLSKSPVLAQTIADFGGLEGLRGQWKIAGLAAMVAKAEVNLTYTRAGFFVEIDKKYTKPFYLCATEDRPGQVVMRVQGAENPAFAKLVLKPGRKDDSMSVAVSKSGWKFLKFKRAN